MTENAKGGNIPSHIGIIMDGNGRWAKSRGLPRPAGHQAGVQAVRCAVETCAELGVSTLTLFTFSTENWTRPSAEVDFLMRLAEDYARRELPELLRMGAGREDVLPFPLKLRAGVFDRQCIWKGNSSETVGEIVFVKQLDMSKMAVQFLHGSIGQDGNAIFETLSIANHDLVLVEIDILDP